MRPTIKEENQALIKRALDKFGFKDSTEFVNQAVRAFYQMKLDEAYEENGRKLAKAKSLDSEDLFELQGIEPPR